MLAPYTISDTKTRTPPAIEENESRANDSTAVNHEQKVTGSPLIERNSNLAGDDSSSSLSDPPPSNFSGTIPKSPPCMWQLMLTLIQTLKLISALR